MHNERRKIFLAFLHFVLKMITFFKFQLVPRRCSPPSPSSNNYALFLFSVFSLYLDWRLLLRLKRLKKRRSSAAKKQPIQDDSGKRAPSIQQTPTRRSIRLQNRSSLNKSSNKEERVVRDEESEVN